MKKKILYVICVLFWFGCYEYMPPGIGAGNIAGKYIDSLYRRDSIGTKLEMGYITLKDYKIAVKRKALEQDTDLNKVSAIHWDDFTRKANDIVAKRKDRDKGAIIILNYQIRNLEHTTAFFIDSSARKVFDTIQMK